MAWAGCLDLQFSVPIHGQNRLQPPSIARSCILGDTEGKGKTHFCLDLWKILGSLFQWSEIKPDAKRSHHPLITLPGKQTSGLKGLALEERLSWDGHSWRQRSQQHDCSTYGHWQPQDTGVLEQMPLLGPAAMLSPG